MNLSTRMARLSTVLVLVGAAAAIVIPEGRAGHEDLGPQGNTAYAPDAFERYARNNAPSATRPDDRPGTRGIGSVTSGDASDVISRYLPNNRPDISTGDREAGARFDWSDAGVGAGGILGILLVAGAAVFGIRGHSGPTTH